MYISRKQRAIINSAVKPFYITSNYLGTGLQNLLKFYSKYFARRRCLVQHFLPTYKNCRDTYHLSILFNAYNKKGGYAKKCRPTTWIFYRNVLLTKYGHKKQKKELKQKRKKERKRRQKQSTRVNRSEKSPNPLNELHKKANADCVIVLESSSSNGAEANSKENQENHAEKNDQQTEILANHNENETVTAELTNAKQSDEIAGKEIEFGDETVDNIWNLDIQEVAALITESVNDEKQLNEGISLCTHTLICFSIVELCLTNEDTFSIYLKRCSKKLILTHSSRQLIYCTRIFATKPSRVQPYGISGANEFFCF